MVTRPRYLAHSKCFNEVYFGIVLNCGKHLHASMIIVSDVIAHFIGFMIVSISQRSSGGVPLILGSIIYSHDLSVYGKATNVAGVK